MSARDSRNIGLFGEEGQRRLATAHVVVLGAGGLGMPIVQHCAYLGVGRYTIADADVVDETNLNRLIGATPDDVGVAKVEIAARLIRSVLPRADVTVIPRMVPDDEIARAIATATVVVGCFDAETPRLVVTDLCSAAGVPYVDVATEVMSTPTGVVYGGRVIIAGDGDGCLACLDVVDQVELARERMTDEQRQVHDKIYGVDRDELGGSGPSVVTVNGVVASLAATEAMCLLTGLRTPRRQLTYRGDLGTVSVGRDAGSGGCPYCMRWVRALCSPVEPQA